MTWHRCMRILLRQHFSQAQRQQSVLPVMTNKALGAVLWMGWVRGSPPVFVMSGTQVFCSKTLPP